MSGSQPRPPDSEEAILKNQGYEFLKKLGEGTFAKVYQTKFISGSEPENVRYGACKIIDTTKATKIYVGKFLPRELSALSKLDHPYIIGVNAIVYKNPKYYIFMPLAENGDMLDYVHKHGRTPENQARIWTRQLALAVQYLHKLEITHRDIKCENILLTGDLDVRLSDFGFARSNIDENGRSVMCRTYCGSMLYAAPEVVKGDPYNAKLSDAWSIGVVLFIAVNKIYPFHTKSTKLLYQYQVKRMYRVSVNAVLSQEVQKVIRNLLEPSTAKRWRVRELLECEWFAMDPPLTTLNDEEKQALDRALEKRKTFPGNLGDSSESEHDTPDSEYESAESEKSEEESKKTEKSGKNDAEETQVREVVEIPKKETEESEKRGENDDETTEVEQVVEIPKEESEESAKNGRNDGEKKEISEVDQTQKKDSEDPEKIEKNDDEKSEIIQVSEIVSLKH